MMTSIAHKTSIFSWFPAFSAVLLLLMVCGSSAIAGNALPNEHLLKPEKIREAVKRYIVRNAPWNSEQMRITGIKFNHAIRVPSGNVSLRVTAPKHTDWIGATPFGVHVMVQGQRVKRITVPVNIEVWSDVIVSVKPLGKYQPIGRDDIRVEKMNLARVPSNAVVSMDQALGLRANRNITADCILRKDQIESSPVVKRGDIVQVIAQTPLLKISVKGMAKQNGSVGDRIKVINLRSKKAIYAQVIDDQTVRVEF